MYFFECGYVVHRSAIPFSFLRQCHLLIYIYPNLKFKTGLCILNQVMKFLKSGEGGSFSCLGARERELRKEEEDNITRDCPLKDPSKRKTSQE